MTTDSNDQQVINPVNPDLPKVALVVGTDVVQVMAVDEGTLAALKSNPDRIMAGDEYNQSTGKFTRYEDVLIARAKAAKK